MSGWKTYLQKLAATRLEITPQKKTKSNNEEKEDREGCLLYTSDAADE